MEGIFKPESKTIEELFGDKSSYYKIPVYQRPYTWEEEHVDDLWTDIYTAFENNQDDSELDKNYFLGSVILTPNDDGVFNIIDGQQRMTTLIILFCVLRDRLKEEKNIDFKEIEIEDIEESIIKRKKIRVTLNTHIKNQVEFQENILKQVKYPKKFTKKDAMENKYMNTAIIFKKKIDELMDSNFSIGNFLDYLFKNVRIITITCSSQNFAIKLFQTLNARGMDLSPADLIKSHLMGNLDEKQHDQFLQNWIAIEEIAKRLGENIGDILNYYQYYLLGNNPKKSMYDILVDKFKDQDPITIVHSLKTFADSYEEVMNEKKISIYSLMYLRHQVYWKTILTTAKYLEYENYDKLITLIRNHYYKFWIAGYTSQKIKIMSFTLIKMIKNKDSIETIKNILGDKERSNSVDTHINNNLLDMCYGEAWCKPLLILLEQSLVDTDNLLNYIEIDKKIHVEHILPISWEKESEWSNLFISDDADEYLHNIANLTLLSGTKNIRASNSSFELKKDIYKGKGKDGITSFLLTQEISKLKKWTLQEVEERQEKLIKQIQNILDIEEVN